MLGEMKKELAEAKQKRDAVELDLIACREEYGRLAKELRAADARGRDLNLKLDKARDKVKEIEAKIAQTNKPLRVSDHAVVRYLQRKLGLNLDQVRAEILTPDLVEKIVRLGDGKYGMVVVKDRTVVTYLE